MALTKRAKLPVGKMVRVKRDEVVTGYQANRDGTTSLLIEKKRRAPNPKRGSKAWRNRPRGARDRGSAYTPFSEMGNIDEMPDTRQKKVKSRKAAVKRRPNVSVRKSKKYFKRAAKRLGVKLPKRVPRKVTHSKGNPAIIFTPEIGTNGKGIVVARCSGASALYNVGRGYSRNDSDECPATKDGSWPAPPKSVQKKAKALAAKASRE